LKEEALIALCGGIVLEEVLDLSHDRLLMMMIVIIIKGDRYQSTEEFKQDKRPY